MKEFIVILLLILLVWAVSRSEMFGNSSIITDIGNFARSGAKYGEFRKLYPDISPLKFAKMVIEYNEGKLTDDRVAAILIE